MNEFKSNKTLQKATKQKAIKLLSAGMSKTDVANELGISRDVIYDWLKSEEFRQAINIEIDTSTRQLSEKLSQLDTNAINAIERALNSNNDMIALKAALGFIEARKTLSQIDSICTRIEELEKSITPKHFIVDNTNKELLESAKICANSIKELGAIANKR